MKFKGWFGNLGIIYYLCGGFNHRENGGTLGMVPVIINPIYTLYSGYLYWVYHGISPFKGLLGGVKQLGYHLKGTTIFPMIQIFFIFTPPWGRFPFWRSYFSNGLKPPTSYITWPARLDWLASKPKHHPVHQNLQINHYPKHHPLSGKKDHHLPGSSTISIKPLNYSWHKKTLSFPHDSLQKKTLEQWSKWGTPHYLWLKSKIPIQRSEWNRSRCTKQFVFLNLAFVTSINF